MQFKYKDLRRLLALGIFASGTFFSGCVSPSDRGRGDIASAEMDDLQATPQVTRDPFARENMESFVNANFARYKEELRYLISIPSDTNNKAEVEKALAAYLKYINASAYFNPPNTPSLYKIKAQSLLDNQVGIIDIGDGKETIGVVAHLDVVSLPETKKYLDLQGKELAGYLYGRGVVDNKGPLATVLLAMKYIQENKIHLNKKVRLYIGTQEELDWTDMRAFLQAYGNDPKMMPVFSFTPDGDFPIVNVEKGYADIKLLFTSPAMPQKGNIAITEIKAGQSINSVAESATVLLRASEPVAFKATYTAALQEFCSDTSKGFAEFLPKTAVQTPEKFPNCTKAIALEALSDMDFKLKFTGVAAHSSYPEKALNPISVMARFMRKFEENIATPAAGNLFKYLDSYFGSDPYGSALGLKQDYTQVNGEDVGNTTIIPSLVKTTSDGFEVVFNARTSYNLVRTKDNKPIMTPDSKKSNTWEKLNTIFADPKFKEFHYTFSFGQVIEPIYIAKEQSHLKILNKVYAKHRKDARESNFRLAHYTTYAKIMPNCVNFGFVFPGSEDTAHEEDERVKIEDLKSAASLYIDALIELAK